MIVTMAIERARFAVSAALFVLALASLARPAVADFQTPALGAWIAGSSTVGFGTVGAVDEGQPAGGFTLRIDFDEFLAGTSRTNWSVAGSDSFSDGVPHLPVGTPVLAFVPLTGAAGEGSVVPVPTSNRSETRTAVQTVIVKGAALRLADVQAGLRVSAPALAAPRPVRAMLLEELTPRMNTADDSGIVDMACTSGGFPADARLWAVGRVGARRIATGRTCLEAMIATPGIRDLAIAAADALGELGAPESAAAMLATLPRKPRDPKVRRRDAESDVSLGSGPANDAEEQTSLPPDTGESSGPSSDTGDGPTAGNAPPADDAEPPVDRLTLPDAGRRRSDAGLTVAVVLSLGKIGSPSAVGSLLRLAKEGDSLALHSTVVNALGMIADRRATAALGLIARTHPNVLVRTQAAETLARRP